MASGRSGLGGMAAMRMMMATEAGHNAVDDLARALDAHKAAFTPWQRHDPAFKPVIIGFIWARVGPSKIYVLLDTNPTSYFICTQRLPAPAAARVYVLKLQIMVHEIQMFRETRQAAGQRVERRQAACQKVDRRQAASHRIVRG